MKRRIVVSFLLVTVFLVSVFPMKFSRAADSNGALWDSGARCLSTLSTSAPQVEAQGELVDTIIIPSTSGSVYNSTIILQTGVWYTFEASGIFYYHYEQPQYQADANYGTTDSWTTHYSEPPGSVGGLFIVGLGSSVIKPWGDYSPQHVYDYSTVGPGSHVGFYINDSYYSDNQGSLMVNIYARADWWPMFHHDPSHTGTSTSTAPTTNNTLWTYTTGGQVWSSPAVVGGFVYVGSFDNRTYCLNAITGAFVWSYKTGGPVQYSSPAVAGGLVYIGSKDGNVYCLNAANGTLIWRYTTGGYLESSPAVAGGMVYVTSTDGNVYCLDAAMGGLIWTYQTGAPIHESSPAVVGGFVYVGTKNHKIYCLNVATRTLVWNYTTGGWVDSSPAVVGGLVFVGSDDGNVYCLNAASGALVWNYTTGGYVGSCPAVVGGFVYVGSVDGYVYCLNAATGAKVWSYPTGDWVVSSPAVVGGLVFVGSEDNSTYCLNAASGALVWKYKTGCWVSSSPAVVNGVVYVGSLDDKIYAFGAPAVQSTGGVVGITGYKLVFDESLNNTSGSPVSNVGYWWSYAASDGTSGNTAEAYTTVPTGTSSVLSGGIVLKTQPAWNTNITVTWTFYLNITGTIYTIGYGPTALNVHAADIAGAASVTFPWLGADGKVGTLDLHVLGVQWGLSSVGANPTSDLARADINGDGKVGTADLHILGVEWGQTW